VPTLQGEESAKKKGGQEIFREKSLAIGENEVNPPMYQQ